MSSLAPVPSSESTCEHCGAALVADQRYCLSCGQPCSPVRLAFLDVLDADRQPQALSPAAAQYPVAYAQPVEVAGPAWLRRYAPLMAVLSVLLLALIVGLLVGHWVTQSKAPSGPTVVKVEGLGGLQAASGTSTTSSTPASTTKSSTGSGKSEEEKEQAEAKAEEKAEEKSASKAPPAKKLESSAVKKLESSTGKTHEEELNKLTTAPIEVK